MTPEQARRCTRRWAKRQNLRPDACELCGRTVAEIEAERAQMARILAVSPVTVRRTQGRRAIVAHHWRGYDYPEDVWWICYPCNTKLTGAHDGRLTLDQARAYVRDHRTPGAPTAGWNVDRWLAEQARCQVED